MYFLLFPFRWLFRTTSLEDAKAHDPNVDNAKELSIANARTSKRMKGMSDLRYKNKLGKPRRYVVTPTKVHFQQRLGWTKRCPHCDCDLVDYRSWTERAQKARSARVTKATKKVGRRPTKKATEKATKKAAEFVPAVRKSKRIPLKK